MNELGFEPRHLDLMLPLRAKASLVQGEKFTDYGSGLWEGVIFWWGQGLPGESCGGHISTNMTLQLEPGFKSSSQILQTFKYFMLQFHQCVCDSGLVKKCGVAGIFKMDN